MTLWLVAAGAVCALLFVALGRRVTHRPLSRFDARAMRDAHLALAIALTNSGYASALTILSVAAVAAALVLHFSARIPLAIVALQLVSQLAAAVAKGLFGRPRPGGWLYRREIGMSYPSGHATTAVVFYGSWLVVVWNSPLPPAVRAVACAVLAAWAAGICWSRVALAAHYPTDVAGGVLLGLSCVTCGLAFKAS